MSNARSDDEGTQSRERAYLLGLRRGRRQARAELRALADELEELQQAIEQPGSEPEEPVAPGKA